MKIKLLALLIPAAMHSMSALAADCSVSGDGGTLTCEPGQVYVPANHNGKSIHAYEKYIVGVTANQSHGYAQWSNQHVFKDVDITVSGAQGDGVRLMNWGPTVAFRNLTIHASGESGDGINVGRDNTDGKVTVHGHAKIHSESGYGVRAVSSGYKGSGGDHTINLLGSSHITTGSHDDGRTKGHAVIAGTQESGCGPFGLPLFNCYAEGRGVINLLGGETGLHTIETTGDRASGLYAAGRGTIVAVARMGSQR